MGFLVELDEREAAFWGNAWKRDASLNHQSWGTRLLVADREKQTVGLRDVVNKGHSLADNGRLGMM